MHTKFEVPNFTHFKDMIMAPKFKMGHVTWPRPFQAGTCYQQPIYQMKSQSPPTTKIWKATQYVEIGVVLGTGT